MGVPLINVLYSSGDPGTVGVLSTPLLLYHVEQLILGNIEVELLKKWVTAGEKKRAAIAAAEAGEEQDLAQIAEESRDEEEHGANTVHNTTHNSYDSQVTQAASPYSHLHSPSPLSQLHYYEK